MQSYKWSFKQKPEHHGAYLDTTVQINSHDECDILTRIIVRFIQQIVIIAKEIMAKYNAYSQQ
jgi:hypothetical protein